MLYNDSKEDYKYKSWVFTWNADNDNFLLEKGQLEGILKYIAENYVFQLESASRNHYQGYFKLVNRSKKHQLLTKISNFCARHFSDERITIGNLTLAHMFGSEEDCISYVTKTDTRVEGPVYSPDLRPYKLSDIAILSQRDRWYPWQDTLGNLIEKDDCLLTPDDRHIIWIRDAVGCSGKSKLVKHYVVKYSKEIIKLPFGSSTQLRSVVCTAGPKRVYFIDIPRTMALGEDMDTVYSVIEDIKNGFVSSSMYGKFQQLLFEPPHILVFSNKDCPLGKLSKDRWINYAIIDNKLIKINGYS